MLAYRCHPSIVVLRGFRPYFVCTIVYSAFSCCCQFVAHYLKRENGGKVFPYSDCQRTSFYAARQAVGKVVFPYSDCQRTSFYAARQAVGKVVFPIRCARCIL